ncbi:hypothetical protein K4L44_00005 [Halosquirtibacter laminarini]|uniref:Uncharacterized protein n=1 Tax=Halosquirtibacter laminarini TaxID=3374600 RepID=A0AC61NJ81_9BACT|nr:hypothetical protein K4L44_00005 [Prolixibacteraceae bacterium]
MRLNLLLIALVLLSACGVKNKNKAVDSKKGPDVVIACEEWSENKAFSLFTKKFLESKGYSVKILMTSDGMLALNKNKAQVFLEKWSTSDLSRNEDDILEHIGDIYKGGRLGLIVPKYFSATSIDELNDYHEDLGGVIYSIDTSSEGFVGANVAKKRYQLDFKVNTMTEKELLVLFEDLYSHRKPFCLTGWFPHPMLNEKYLTILEDPKHAYGSTYNLEKYCRKDWKSENKELANLISKITFSKSEFDVLVKMMGDYDWDLTAATEAWYKELEPNFLKK